MNLVMITGWNGGIIRHGRSNENGVFILSYLTENSDKDNYVAQMSISDINTGEVFQLAADSLNNL